jgi:hypothetical protein
VENVQTRSFSQRSANYQRDQIGLQLLLPGEVAAVLIQQSEDVMPHRWLSCSGVICRHRPSEGVCRTPDPTDSFVGKGSRKDELYEYTLTEEFADFEVAAGLTLPRSCKLRFASTNNGRNPDTIDWSVAFKEIWHNQQLDPKTLVLK